MARVYDRPIYREGNLVKKMYRNGDLIYYRLNPQPYEHMPLTFDIKSGGTICWQSLGGSFLKTIQVSINGGNWTNITSSTAGTSFNVASGDTVQVRGDNPTYASSNTVYNTFRDSTAAFDLYGNIMSLIDSTGYTTATTLSDSYTFTAMFYGCTGLQSAKNLVLPATALAQGCYYGLFAGCINLAIAPELPATTLARSCYYSMFSNCTSLTAGPSSIPATSMANSACTYMFYGCTSLVTAPALSASTLATYCYYQMFAGCTSLVTAPDLNCSASANFFGFWYQGMFSGCSSLNHIKCLLQGSSSAIESTCQNWTTGVAENGTFIKNSSTTWPTGVNGIPSGWTVEDAT